MTSYEQYLYNLAHKRRDAVNIFNATRNSYRGWWAGGYAVIKDSDLSLDTYLKRKERIGLEGEHAMAMRVAKALTNRHL